MGQTASRAPFVRIVAEDGIAYPAASAPLSGAETAGAAQSAPAAPATLLTADARKVSPRGFLEALGLTSPELREARRQETREQCIRAIKRGDTHGFPPVLVAECRDLIAERETGLSAPAGWNRIEL